MLESVIAYFIRSYLGEYLENVATDQLSFLLLSGCVEIENLPVKTDGIRKLRLPINIKAGFVRKLKLKIPLSALKSQPWEVVIQGLYVIIEPSELGKINEDEEIEFEKMNKMKRLQKMEESWKEEQKQRSSDGSWTSKLIATILENLQVSIEQVHIRYEERNSADMPYSLGLRIDKLAAHSTNENWEQNFTSNRAKSWKLVELTNLEVYTDNVSHHNIVFQPLDLPQVLNSLGKIEYSIIPYNGPGECFRSDNLYTFSNLMEPVSCEAKVIRNRNPHPLQLEDGPRYQLYIELPNVKLSLSKLQYKCLIGTGDAFDMYYRSRAVRKWRPDVPVIGNSRIWWNFAYKVHHNRICERNHRRSWEYIVNRVSSILFYSKTYEQRLLGSVKLSRSEQSRLTAIENEFSFDEISILRRLVMSQVEDHLSVEDSGSSFANYTSYWSSWLPAGWGTATPALPETDTQGASSTQISSELPNFSPAEFEEELDDFLELDSQTSNSFLFRDHQFASACFSMQEGSLSLYDTSRDEQGIVDMNFNYLKLIIDVRPRISYYRSDLSLASIQILDKHHLQSFFPVLVGSIGTKSTTVSELFSLCVVKRKSKKFAGLSITGRSQPLEVICNMEIVSLLQDFFRLPYIPSGSNLEENLTQIVHEKLKALKSYTVKEIRPVIAEALQDERWWSSKHLNLDLEISAPLFVLPEDFCLQESKAVIIDLGLFTLKTMEENNMAGKVASPLEIENDSDDDFGTPVGGITPQELPLSTDTGNMNAFEDYFTRVMLNNLYDRYQLDIKNLQILVTNNYNSESWKLAYNQSSTPLHVLDKLTVSLQLCRRLKFTCDPSESNIAITGALPRLDIHIDEAKFSTILRIQENLMKTLVQPQKMSRSPGYTPRVINTFDNAQTKSMSNSILWVQDQNYWDVEKRKFLMETKLLDASFTFQEVTLSFSHHNRVIIQLRVPGIKLNHMQRPYDYYQSLTIQDVFVADALQRFGTQYELLIYSQGREKYYREENGNLIYASSLDVIDKSVSNEAFYSVIQVQDYETNALLKLDRQVIFQESPNSEFPHNTEKINANFTSLNIIANQETLVEVLAFLNSLPIQSIKNQQQKEPEEEMLAYDTLKTQLEPNQSRFEISAKFQCLTAKFVCSQGPNDLREVGLIMGYGLNLELLAYEEISITGHLKGISLENLMESDGYHRKLLSVGKLDQANPEDNNENAFTFQVLYNLKDKKLKLDFELASVRYTHSSQFLFCLQQCFSEFQYYITRARASLESAAKDMAYSLFHKGEAGEPLSPEKKPTKPLGEDVLISYNILVNAPTLQLENQENRADKFIFNLGEITISNRSGNYTNPNFEHIIIQVRNVYMLARIDNQSYRILENTNSKISVVRKLNTSASILECEYMSEIPIADFVIHPQIQLVLFASFNDDIQVNLHKICFDSFKEIFQQNSDASKVLLNPRSVSETLTLGSENFIGENELKSIFFWAGCRIHNITLTISQDIGLETKKIVAFSTSNFSASAYQDEQYLLTIDTKLGGVRGFDLVNDSKRSFLVTSYLQDYTTYPEAFCQYSTLPEILSYQSPLRAYKLSLNEVMDISSQKQDETPLKMQDLVSTKIILVDSNHSDFSNSYQGITTHASVKMNHIHFIINLQTWVLLLDFFGMTPNNDNLISPIPSVTKSPTTTPPLIPFKPLSSLSPLDRPMLFSENPISDSLPLPLADPDEEELVSIPASSCSSVKSGFSSLVSKKSKLSILLDVSINSLIAIFNKSDYPLTCNSAIGFKSSVKMENGDISVVGELGKASLIDLSPHGRLYRERFVTHGENALYFEFFRYGEPDINLAREFDIRASFRMASVRYVHTKRFMSENLAFCQHFFQLVDAFQRMKAKSSGNISFSGPERHPRIKLDVSAASPIIFIPSHGLSPYLFIGELGHITVSNQFLFDGKKGTWTQRNRSSPYRSPLHSKTYQVSPIHKKEHSMIENSLYKGPCLLDVMRIDLQGNDVFTAEFDTQNCVFVREDSRILKEKLNYRVVFEHNLHMPMCHTVPNFRFEIHISDSHCMLDKKQMDAFKTFLSKNLGETLEEFERPTSVIRDPIIFEDFEDRWVELSFCFNFQHVCLEFISSRATHRDDFDQFLSRFYMHNTTLQVEILSDSTKDIDFISREMSIVDVRYDDYAESQKPSIYREVLLTRNAYENDPSTSSLQVEVHAKLSPHSMEYTIILNNLRMIFMMDLALQCWSFVADSSEEFRYLFDLPEVLENSIHRSSLETAPSQKSRDLQIKLSVTETDFVVIEDLTSPDTQALVCKGITVLTFTSTPTYGFTWNMIGVELFSCCLASEEETALSIIDPLNIIVEIPRNHKLSHSYPLHIEIQTVNTRLSYNDIKLFAAIFNSISSILHLHQMSSNSYDASDNKVASSSPTNSMSKPEIFDSFVIIEKLPKSNVKQSAEKTTKQPDTFGEITVHIEELKLVFIDDCGNCDIPLGELSIEHVSIQQKFYAPFVGKAKIKLATNYYNRYISAWEPLVEPYKFSIEWQRDTRNKFVKGEGNILYPHYSCTLLSDDTLLLNFTSSLLDILKNTQNSWGEDLTQFSDSQPLGLPMTGSINQGKMRSQGSATQLSSLAVRSISGFNFRKRQPFIPFRLENNTGLPLRFATLTKNPYKVSYHSVMYDSTVQSVDPELRSWIEVPVGNSMSFAFEKKTKIRHQHLQNKTIHLLVVAVEGWKETRTPVSADQVGIVFRDLKPKNTSYPSVKLIFTIKLDGAIKVINVRTPIAIKNELKFEMEIKLTGELEDQSSQEFSIKPDCFASIPLDRQQSEIFIRPRGWGAQYPSHPLNLESVDRSDLWRICVPFGQKEQKMYKQSFIYTYSAAETRKTGLTHSTTTPPVIFKTIVLTHPFVIENLLPQDIAIEINDLNQTKYIKPGASIPIISFTPTRGFSFFMHMDNFRHSNRINISPFYSELPTVQNEIIRDDDNRPLQLTIALTIEKCPARKVTIMAQYWMINKSNLPLIFREENSESEAAGQFGEHETARCLLPLPFSFIQSDPSDAQCQVRLGKAPLLPSGRPSWSESFRLLTRGGVIQLYMQISSNTVPVEYHLAVEITKGAGKYKDITMITFINRFQLENLTTLPIRFIQNCQFENNLELIEFSDSTKQMISPKSVTPFNWPRSDRDNFLRIVYADIPGIFWSGPFKVIEEDSFVLSMRSKEGNLYFVRVNIRQKNLAYIVRFSDTQNIPPPFIIENYSQVQIKYVQSSLSSSYKHCIKPGQSKPYAWDEILSEQKLKIFVDDIDENVMYDPLSHNDQLKLYYENYFYIALYDTFSNECNIPGKELVLSVVPNSHKVEFTRKTNHPSQHWRMTGAGKIQHVSSQKQGKHLVLDIEGGKSKAFSAAIPVVLREKDDKRDPTQKWEFIDGLLTLTSLPHQCVCAKILPISFNSCDAVLVANPKSMYTLKECSSLPSNHHIRILKCKPGSGMLSVRIYTKGPSSIVRITDDNSVYHHLNISPLNWNIPEAQVNPIMKLLQDEEMVGTPYEFIFSCQLSKGIGLSLVSNGEELVFTSFDNVTAIYKRNNKSELFELSLENIQVDSQITETHTTAIFYVEESEDTRKPAFSVAFERQFDSSPGFYLFKFLHIELKSYVLTIDERVLLKFLQFVGFGQKPILDQPSSDVIKSHLVENSFYTKYFYFRDIFIDSTKLKTSVFTASNLSPQLQATQYQLGLKLVKFQATIALSDYQRKHTFDRIQEHVTSICHHYKENLSGQALKVLGSVDFLGNPVGLFNDVTKGIAGLIMFRHGFSGLLRDVTHGLSDSTSKITGSAGNLVSYITFDKQFQKEREELNPVVASSAQHLGAGKLIF